MNDQNSSEILSAAPGTCVQPALTAISRRRVLKGVLAATAAMAANPLAAGAAKPPQVKPAPGTTIFGGFDVQSIEEALAIDAQAVRLIVPIIVLQKIMGQARHAQADHGPWPWPFVLMRALHKSGIKVVVTFLWANWGHPMPIPEVNSHRGQQWLQVVREFTHIMGDQLYYVTMDNEPLTFLHAADWHKSPTGHIKVLDWYSAVAEEIHKIRPDLPISAPAINILQQVMTMTPATLKVHGWVKACAAYTREMCAWTNRNGHISALDLHLYVKDVAQMKQQLAFARTLTDKPFLSTEWSQLPALNGWINQPLDRQFAAQWKQPATRTNAAYSEACMQHPVSLNQWNDFMATAPLSPTFMQQACTLMGRNRVLLSAYSGGRQYKMIGNPVHVANYAKDAITMLYANATVVPLHGRWQPNYKLVRWFKAVAKENT